MTSSYTSVLLLVLVVLAVIVFLIAVVPRIRGPQSAATTQLGQQHGPAQSVDPRPPREVVVSRVCLGFEVSLTMQNEKGLTLVARSEGDISFRIGDDTFRDPQGELRPTAVAFIYGLFNNPGQIELIGVKGPDLVVTYIGGNTMTFHGSDRYMSWQVWGKGNVEIVGCYEESNVVFESTVGTTWDTWF